MIEKLVTTKILEELKEEKLPIYIWGGGTMGYEVWCRLKESGIHPAGCYYTINTPILTGQRIPIEMSSLDEILDSCKEFVVIVGHGHYEKWMEAARYDEIKRIYIMANPYIQYRERDMDYVLKNQEYIFRIRNMLKDDESKEVFDLFLDVKFKDDVRSLLMYGKYSGSMYGPALKDLQDDCTFLDVGAWTGDSIDAFLKEYQGDCKAIYAIEPDKVSYQILLDRFQKKIPLKAYCCGLGAEESSMYINSSGSQSNVTLNNNSEKLETVMIKTIDGLFNGIELNLIKIFVPFLAESILAGTKEYIKKMKPKLIVNVGADDRMEVLTIVEYLKQICPTYEIQLYFDFLMSTRLFLYARSAC